MPEDNQTHDWKDLVYAIVFTLVFGMIPFGILYGKSWLEDLGTWVVSIASGLAGTLVGYETSRRLKQQSVESRTVANLPESVRQTILQEMKTCENRLGNVLRCHALHTRDGVFESILSQMEDDHHREVRWIIAKSISRKLNDAFRDDRNDLMLVTRARYAGHAAVFADMAAEATGVCLTCIYDPQEWFTLLLDAQRREYLRAGSKFNGREYPAHYVTFLENPKHGERTRVFLMDEDRWGRLTDPANESAFEAFVGPCEETPGVLTVFVRLSEALDTVGGSLTAIPMPVELTDRGWNPEDYNLFDYQVVMTWDGEQVKLKMGLINRYTELFSTVRSLLGGSKGSRKGVYTTKEIREEITQRKATVAPGSPSVQPTN